MTKTERIDNMVQSAIEQVNVGRTLDQKVFADRSTLLATPLGPPDSLSIVELMESRFPLPVLPEWQPCISLKDDLAAFNTESHEYADGDR